MLSLLNVLLMYNLLMNAIADLEHLQHAGNIHMLHEVDGNHNVEFDHEAILGSQDLNDEFSKLSAHEARQRLSVLLHRMDTNADLLISQQEISDWVLKSFRNQDEQETHQKFIEVDTNADGLLTWPEYAGKVFGYSEDDLLKFTQDSNSEMQTFNRMVGDEKSKFYLADRNADSKLDVTEYAAFLHPQNYDYMHDHEIDNALVDYDKNRDGFVSFAEYLGESAKPDREQLIVDRENFNSYDTDTDGRLDRSELRAWILPDRRSVADEEAEHLVSETDMNHDEILTFDEILDRHDLWVGSAATDYGEKLRRHDPAEL